MIEAAALVALSGCAVGQACRYSAGRLAAVTMRLGCCLPGDVFTPPEDLTTTTGNLMPSAKRPARAAEMHATMPDAQTKP